MRSKENLQILFDLMLHSERKSAITFIEKLLEEGFSAEYVVRELLDPALVRQGAMWGEGHLSLAQAYVAAKIAEDILMKCLEFEKADDELIKRRGIIVIGNIEDDFHSLGRKIVSIFLKANGWEIIDLGNDVMAEDFVEEAIKSNSSIIGVSAMMYTTAQNIKKVRAEIDARGLQNQIKLAVGGAVFNGRPELVKEVGGDGSAKNAFETLELMDRLLHGCCQRENQQ